MSSLHSNVLSFTLEEAEINQELLKYELSIDVELAIKMKRCPAVTPRDTQFQEGRIERFLKERKPNHGNE